jgi:hypothetical protein
LPSTSLMLHMSLGGVPRTKRGVPCTLQSRQKQLCTSFRESHRLVAVGMAELRHCLKEICDSKGSCIIMQMRWRLTFFFLLRCKYQASLRP